MNSEANGNVIEMYVNEFILYEMLLVHILSLILGFTLPHTVQSLENHIVK